MQTHCEHWSPFGRSGAHGVCLETLSGHAEIQVGRTDHQVRCTVQRVGQRVHSHLFCTQDAAQRWAERQLLSGGSVR